MPGLKYTLPVQTRSSAIRPAVLAGGQDHVNVITHAFRIGQQDLKYAAGGVIRYAISRKEKINLRIDLGVSPYGVFPYVLFQEAF